MSGAFDEFKRKDSPNGEEEKPVAKEAKPAKKPRLLRRERRAGRKPLTDSEKRDQHVGTLLTYKEYDDFIEKLDGRPASVIIRNYVLMYTYGEQQ